MMTNISHLLTAALLASVFVAPAVQAADTMARTQARTTTTTRTMAANDAPPQRGVYLAGQAGLNLPTRDEGTLDNAAVFAGALGYRFNPNVRTEIEGAYRKNDFDDTSLGVLLTGDTKITTGLINAYYDFANNSFVTPYVGVGVGFAHGTLDITGPGGSARESDNAFAWQGIAGLAYNVSQQIDLTADYRYLDTANFSDLGTDYSAHEVRAGLRYNF